MLFFHRSRISLKNRVKWQAFSIFIGTRVKQFSPNARLYLVSAILTGAALGVYQLLFNFYILSLKMDVNVAGQLASTNSTTALILAVPMGYLADYLGRKKSLIISGAAVCLAIAGMVIWPIKWIIFAMSALDGSGPESLCSHHVAFPVWKTAVRKSELISSAWRRERR